MSRAKHLSLRDNLAAVRAAIAALIRVMGSLVNLSPIARAAKQFFRTRIAHQIFIEAATAVCYKL